MFEDLKKVDKYYYYKNTIKYVKWLDEDRIFE